MTPSTSLTFEDFIQGLQANMMGLVASLIFVSFIFFLFRLFINKAVNAGEIPESQVKPVRRTLNMIGFALFFVVVAWSCLQAVIYATNLIPRSSLDRSSISDDMDKNIKP